MLHMRSVTTAVTIVAPTPVAIKYTRGTPPLLLVGAGEAEAGNNGDCAVSTTTAACASKQASVNSENTQ